MRHRALLVTVTTAHLDDRLHLSHWGVARAGVASARRRPLGFQKVEMLIQWKWDGFQLLKWKAASCQFFYVFSPPKIW